MLIKNAIIRYEPLPVIEDHESIWCKLFMDRFVLIIGVLYRVPGSSSEFLQKLDVYI